MAYGPRRTSRARPAPRRAFSRAPARSSRSAGRGRSAPRALRGGGVQTVKLVIQSAPAPQPVAQGVETPQVQQLLGRAKF